MTTVRFVGCGDAFGSGGRLQTCILVDDDGWRCLIDCGTSSLIGLKREGINPASIDAIAISHLHADHFGGLPFLLLDAQLNNKRDRPLLVAGHESLEARLRATMDLLYPGSQRALELVETNFVTLDPARSATIGAAQLEVFDVEHSCGAPPFAVRLTTPNGCVVTYSGDTEWTDTLLAASDGADLFIIESSFYDRPVKGHMSYTTLVEKLPLINSGQVVITHMGPAMLERVDTSAVPAAHDGLVLQL